MNLSHQIKRDKNLIWINLSEHNICYDNSDKTISIDDNGHGNENILSPEESINLLKFCVQLHTEIYGK